MTETMRLLGLNAVEDELKLDLKQWTALSSLARAAQTAPLTEDQALTAVAKILTETQTARLTELLVQDLGYGSLTLSSVRAKLSLTTDQTTAMVALSSTLDDAKKAAATPQALAQLKTTTNAAFAKLLTSDQDAKLRALAGRTLQS